MDNTLIDTKNELIQWLSSVEDEKVIDQILEIQKENSKDWYPRLSSEERESINKGIADADKGNLVERSLAKKLYEKWL
ncbi:hypothetical protein I5M32_02350 [Pedobacter sp. SD-b]|uniref:Addiction module component n=1 Tax=Pedobacter segetis TaxID=2793069 RepID=A0ABS1BHW4_9SPHI|nr:hypothetical protein [Pedobacter segetis]MBK0381789.1 hypothetical protein [Pedobacter segetis]